MGTLINFVYTDSTNNSWPFVKGFSHWLRDYGHFMVEGTEPISRIEIKSHIFHLFSNTRAKSQNPVTHIDPGVSAD